MSYRELVAELAREHAEELSDALLELGALSVSVEDADADTPDEQPLFGEPGLTPDRTAWQHSRVIALLAQEHDPAVLLAAASNEIGLAAAPPFTVREVEEQDWVRLTQSQFDPIPIGERIWVVPSWHDAPDPDALVLELDPGLAFGTGSHPTTRLCMEWLEQSVKPGQSKDFEAAFREAQAIIASMPGYRSHELQRCIERNDQYVLLVRWDSVEAHEVGFRKSPQYQRWRELLHHFYDPFPTVLHYERV